MIYLGDIAPGDTIDLKFTTADADGAPTALTSVLLLSNGWAASFSGTLASNGTQITYSGNSSIRSVYEIQNGSPANRALDTGSFSSLQSCYLAIS
jgi:hypothetical protein